MDTIPGTLWLLHVAAMLVLTTVRCDEEDEPRKGSDICGGPRHVCTTLMKYPDGYVANEGPYCTCSDGNCGSAWSDNDDRALTWQHYERGHWRVQYRFCQSVMAEDKVRECGSGELSTVVKTEVTTWKPYMDTMRCRCRHDLYHMIGWTRDGNVWKYSYKCEKNGCKENDGVCATIFMDLSKKTDIVKEVKFKCACPRGYLCPAKIRDESKETEAQKEVKCQPIKQSHNKI
ncbi:uncharacterized protein LOC124291273 [Haliotis rubra]|uniref:uncharacterized protein LOC124291273 n=1 Tax=Haliotis rubra TaxID=36100 RepID=UPI001EE4EE84|nr:uncharacterized protein LOC124291273 [Haliotis rubra]